MKEQDLSKTTFLGFSLRNKGELEFASIVRGDDGKFIIEGGIKENLSSFSDAKGFVINEIERIGAQVSVVGIDDMGIGRALCDSLINQVTGHTLIVHAGPVSLSSKPSDVIYRNKKAECVAGLESLAPEVDLGVFLTERKEGEKIKVVEKDTPLPYLAALCSAYSGMMGWWSTPSESTTSEPLLVDGKTYQFKFQGYRGTGIYLHPDEEGKEGAFYCNGAVVCNASQASQIERLYSSKEINDSLVVTDSDGDTVEFNWSEGVLELSELKTLK